MIRQLLGGGGGSGTEKVLAYRATAKNYALVVPYTGDVSKITEIVLLRRHPNKVTDGFFKFKNSFYVIYNGQYDDASYLTSMDIKTVPGGTQITIADSSQMGCYLEDDDYDVGLIIW